MKASTKIELLKKKSKIQSKILAEIIKFHVPEMKLERWTVADLQKVEKIDERLDNDKKIEDFEARLNKLEGEKEEKNWKYSRREE